MGVEKIGSGPEMAQNGPERKEAKGRLSKAHQDYWKPRLAKRDYEYDGKVKKVADWSIRIAHLGKREWFNLGTPNRDAAAIKAKDVYLSLIAAGWKPTLAKFKPRMETPQEECTLESFGKLYREALKRVEYPPSQRTAERYLKDLGIVCRTVRVSKITSLTAEKVKEFKGKYLEVGRANDRDEESVKVSCNAILRNAGALFSQQMLTEYQGQGLAFINPFEGQKLRRVVIKAYSPMKRELLDSIWADAARLRDGSPEATVPTKREKGQPVQRWTQPDFRKPHPEAYTLLLLELGLGLRRHEADKAQKDWFFGRDGRWFIEVRETEYFTPKSKERRVIPVEPMLYEAIKGMMDRHVSPFVVAGRLPKKYAAGKAPKNIVYRCDKAHRVLAAWLRAKGVADDKPCHLLRKEFGSYVATAFGLFHAQKMLGHSSPEVTSAFYAGLTNLPELNHAQIGGGK